MACHGWADRKTLAAALNLDYLNPKDIILLEVMSGQGKIEMRSVVGNMKNVKRYEYRIKS